MSIASLFYCLLCVPVSYSCSFVIETKGPMFALQFFFKRLKFPLFQPQFSARIKTSMPTAILIATQRQFLSIYISCIALLYKLSALREKRDISRSIEENNYSVFIK